MTEYQSMALPYDRVLSTHYGLTSGQSMKMFCTGWVGGITLHIKKTVEMAGVLKAYIYLIMDAQLNIQNGALISAVH